MSAPSCSSEFIPLYWSLVSRLNLLSHSPKLIPWFVSDVLPPDFTETFSLLADPATFASPSPSPAPDASPAEILQESYEHLASMVKRWQTYVDEGVFKLSVPLDTPLGGGGEKGRKAEFWTTPYPYWEMETLDGQLVEELKKSGLVIFKVRLIPLNKQRAY